MFDSSFFFHLFPIMFRYIDVTLGISLAALLLALLLPLRKRRPSSTSSWLRLALPRCRSSSW